MAHTEFLDELVKEYLLFRGFSNSLKTMINEQKNDKEKSQRADKIIEILSQCINSSDLNGLVQFWIKLDTVLYSKLEHIYISAVKKLENGLLKIYLITAYNNNRNEKISEFFVNLKSDLSSQNDWKDWFYFPFCKNPEEIATFSIYFSKQWQDTYWLSLRNFLTTIFQCMPVPTLGRLKPVDSQEILKRNQDQTINKNINSKQMPKISNANHCCLSEIQPFDISPPGPIVDDFYIIAAESENSSNLADQQSKGIKSFIKTISSSSPVFGRKD
ncbi:WD repeat-containing protein 91 [Condylostylus longicornis]|uniref:WD repeat-containing protein 91 n=1 Tax=Condylostylus longicornis TaxID=2530218 RepID=UPI00244DCC7E|nr:WD repeat-containing protein 91 [Condylostylus longicornis]